MSFFNELFSACSDMLFAPDCALDSHSGGHCSALDDATRVEMPDAVWHNDFGTGNDYQVTAGSSSFDNFGSSGF
jgi:hypothetical protein